MKPGPFDSVLNSIKAEEEHYAAWIEMLYYKNISVYFVELPATHQWTPVTVQLWLKENKFSDDWIETFQNLNIYGLAFIDLGLSWRLSELGNYGPFGIMH